MPMKVTYVENDPFGFRAEINEHNLTAKDIEDIAEVFHTPLVGAYNWDYTEADNRIKRLYELGKSLNWNGSEDLDWSSNFPKSEYATDQDANAFKGYPPYEKLSEQERIEFSWHQLSQSLSNFLHGEQGALLVASQLVSCAPTYNAKLYAASQAFDEARHVEVFNRYLHQKVGMMYPCTPSLKLLLDKVLTDERWDLKFIGMQIIIEGLALAAFNSMKRTASDPLLRQLVDLVLRDESRHVTFGINYLEEYTQTLSDEDREDRAQFAFEACKIMRNRLIPVGVMERYGWDVKEAREYFEGTEGRLRFRNLLFTRVMPNLRRIGLLTDTVRPKYDELGLLDYEHNPDDGIIDWDDLERPLDYRNEMEKTAPGPSDSRKESA